MRARRRLALGVVAAMAIAPLVVRAGSADGWVIEPTPEDSGAAAAGAADVARAQDLARNKQYVEAVQLLEQVDREHPASVNDCNLALAYLRAGVLTRAQLLWDVSAARGGDRPAWCTGDLAKQLSTALRAAGFVPVTIDASPADAVIEIGGVAMRGVGVVWLAPGPYTIVARAPGHADSSSPVSIKAPSARIVISLAAPEVARAPDARMAATDFDSIAPPDAGAAVVAAPSEWPAWVALGGGAAALGVGAIFHARALSAKDDGDHAYVGSQDLTDAQDRFASARDGAIAGYAIGAIAIGFGAWWWMDHRQHEHAPAIGAAIGAHGGALTLTWGMP